MESVKPGDTVYVYTQGGARAFLVGELVGDFGVKCEPLYGLGKTRTYPIESCFGTELEAYSYNVYQKMLDMEKITADLNIAIEEVRRCIENMA